MHALYCGDTTDESTASRYLSGLLHRGGFQYAYVPSDRSFRQADWNSWKALILSDYPSRRIPERLQLAIVEHIEAGAGLLMIGGNQSFRGTGGYWNDTPLGRLLPVEIDGSDDRVNCDRPLLVKSLCCHPIIDQLPWDERPPLIDGLNRVACKSDDELLLSAHGFDIQWTNGKPDLNLSDVYPLLCVGRRGYGRVAALMTDIAHPWAGPLIHWGTERVLVGSHQVACPVPKIRMSGIEVGNFYADFVTRLVLWTMGRL